MTWAEWLESKYNIGSWFYDGYNGIRERQDGTAVLHSYDFTQNPTPDSIITPNGYYYFLSSGGSSN